MKTAKVLTVEIIHLTQIADERGRLVFAEAGRDIPFDIKRVYYIYDLKSDKVRGCHAHRELTQMAVCLRGSCKFLMDYGYEKGEVILNDSTKGLIIEKMCWHEMFDFSEDCILMVFADGYYDESDYIREYTEFEKLVRITPQVDK